ncbi:MAG: hypothetical protein OEP48_16420 [Betaproteobacteria bacterium]|nr:hypothetical protein [Betaproteobacteria bacterium]MDH3437946.1 hypothetical protein [Betaproteobacteria bacterium]
MSEAPRNEQQRASAPDFLRRVVDGAFERANPIEPRRSSLFEPQTFTAAAAVDWSADVASKDKEVAAPAREEERREREAQRQTLPRDAPAPRDLSRTDMDPPNESRRRIAAELARLVKADHEPEGASGLPARPPARPHEAERDRNILTPAPLQITVDAGRDWRRETGHEPQRPVLDLPSGLLLARKVISTAETIREPTVMRAPESRGALPRSTERAGRLHDHPVSPAPEMQRIVVEPPTVRHRPERDPLHAEVATPSPEPVVNVTIGRIEVRAVPAQPGSTRQRSQGPKPMSLGDYLKQRGGGR